jgi:hypothetical protein
VVQLLPAAQPTPAPQRGRQPLKAIDQKRKTIMHEPLRPANDLNGGAKDNALFDPFEDMTAAAAKAAKDYRSWMLEQMTINMCAALDYANGVASARTASVARPDTPERGTTSYSQSADKTAPAVAKVADEYRAKAFELMTANINTTLQYAQRLVNVTTPAEFVQLSTSHARKQFELIMKQTAELGSITRKLTTPKVE